MSLACTRWLLLMRLNKCIVEDAALGWFRLRRGYGGQVGEQGRVAPFLTPALSQGERESYGEVVLVGRLREAIGRLNPAIPSRTISVGPKH